MKRSMLKTIKRQTVLLFLVIVSRGEKELWLTTSLGKSFFILKISHSNNVFAGWPNSFEKLDRKCLDPQFQRNIILHI